VLIITQICGSVSNANQIYLTRIFTITMVAELSHQLYRVSQEERTKLRESVPYVKLYGYNPKHLYPKLKGYGDNGQRKV